MACTTILVGKKASYDGSTIIARNDDASAGKFAPKKFAVITPDKQPKEYQAVISGCKVELPENPMKYTAIPNAVEGRGIWAACGVNEENVAMTATETITSNPLVLGADPLVKEGIGEEDLVVLVLPYIHSARQGVERLGALLEKYGTYEMNGIAFSDTNEIWWLETIGGHHWMAKRVKDDEYVVMPNQQGISQFDLEDAYGNKREHLCSTDLMTFIENNHLNLAFKGKFNARYAFGSHADSDHVYNTPRAWMILKYFNPHTYKWEGDNADYTPESDDLPWSLIPERQITIEDVKYALSHHYQGTPYDTYGHTGDLSEKGKYRPIGINRTDDLGIIQLRNNMPKEKTAVEWICFGSNVFNVAAPFYTSGDKVPDYYGNTTVQTTTENFYWASRMIGALADAHYQLASIHIERYQNTVAQKAHALLNEADRSSDFDADAVNAKIAAMVKEETYKALDHVLYEASNAMKNAFARSDA
jgi:dipeptidase